MKRRTIIALTICLLLIITSTVPIYAATEEQLTHGPDLLSKERMVDVSKLQDRIERESNIRASGGRILSNVQNEQQSNDYYCGPACTKNVLKYFGVNKTQSTLAGEMGTTLSQGTYVYRIVNCLNSHLGSGTYQYVLTSEIAFGNGLRSSINNNKPLVCHTMTGVLPLYAEVGKDTGHYIVAKGYAYGAQGSTGFSNVTYNDPNCDDRFYGTYTCSWSLMEQAIDNNAGYYIMG